jgi:hypothetical protein
MKTLNRIPSVMVGCLLCFSLLWPKDCDAQIKEMSTEELTAISTAILYGKCDEIRCEWSADQEIILTHVTIIPEEYVKGNLGSEAILTIPGGRVGNIVYEVSEMPVFVVGEEVFTFAWKHPSGKYLVTGGQQGKLKIKKDKSTGKRTVQVMALWESDDPLVKGKDVKKPQKDIQVPLDEFVMKVKGFSKK